MKDLALRAAAPHLWDTVNCPQGHEPRQRRTEAEEDVDGGGEGEAGREHNTRREHVADDAETNSSSRM